jgi:two-component system sensor histidine kinase HydH
LIVEFVPLGSAEALRRALTVLILSGGASVLLTVATVVLWSGARRAEQAQLQQAAQQHLARLGEMSAVLAHEIRNPLAALKGHAQLLAEKATDDAIKTRVDRVVNEAVRLEKLTNDLLTFARSGAIQLAPTNPAALLERAAHATAAARINLSLENAPAVWPLDGARLEEVLINLLENALAATPSGQLIDAGVFAADGALIFSVRDRGAGVPAPERARIFEAFHTTKLRGTGLGLAVAQRIAELHGGRIDVDDAPGGGAVFRVRIPAAERAK